MYGTTVLRCGALLGFVAGIFLICHAALAADAVCNGKAKSTATQGSGGSETPTAWENDSFSCGGTCNPGTCGPNQTGDDTGDPAGQTSTKNADCSTTVVTNIECRCESGAGDSGCREIWEITVEISEVGGTTRSSRMYCAGPCGGGEECEYDKTTAPPGKTGKWWQCKCK